ncbi:MAG: Na+ dependent nucleoside transporter domain protein, partial [Deltaproteobacteria bacterium]
MLKLLSLLGLATFVAMAWAISSNRKKFPWHTVLTGLGLQMLLGLLILKTAPGQAFFEGFQRAAEELLRFANEGTKFVFGPLADGDFLAGKWGPENSFIFVITVTGTIVLVAALSSLFYHYGILQALVRAMAWV